MNAEQIKQLINHYNNAFNEKYVEMIQEYEVGRRSIIMVLYEPTDYENYWKVVTIGASDYKMKLPLLRRAIDGIKGTKHTFRNEFMMCIDEKYDMHNKETASYFYKKYLELF